MNTDRNMLREAQAALDFWQALEYLAPQKPPKVDPEDCVWDLHANTPAEAMPWQDPHKLARLKTVFSKSRWRFQIFGGIVDGVALVDEARAALGATALDAAERTLPSAAATVVVETDAAGMATGQVFVSTLPWAMACLVKHAEEVAKKDAERAIPIDFRGFFGTGGLDETVRNKVRELLVERKLLVDMPLEMEAAILMDSAADDPEAPDGALPDLRPVRADDIELVTQLVFDLCGWAPSKQQPWRIKAFRAPDKEGNDKKAQDDPLNSFFAEDLERVGAHLARDDIGSGLRAYLQGAASPGRIDLEREGAAALIDGVHLSRQPPGCWPAKYPLVTAQQFAVNTMMEELAEDGGLFSVNGPPGTGKTTMLKDIVAAVVTRRADVLATIADPAAVFTGKVEIDNYAWSPAYLLDARLCGFGMVVASANNGAVENITRELPGLDAIVSDIGLDYFSDVADSVGAPAKARRRSERQERWGLITAVLGNKTNRSQFANRFWFADAPKKETRTGPPETPDPRRLRSLPSMIAQGDHGALPWDEARARYRAAHARVEALLDAAAEAEAAIEHLQDAIDRAGAAQRQAGMLAARLPALDSAVAAREQACIEAEADLEQATRQLHAVRTLRQADAAAAHARDAAARMEADMPDSGLAGATRVHHEALAHRKELDQRRDRHMDRRPGLLSELLRLPSSKRWNALGAQLDAEWALAAVQEQEARLLLERATRVAQALPGLRGTSEATSERLDRAMDAAAAVGIDRHAPPADCEQACQSQRRRVDQCERAAQAARDVADAARSECQASQASAAAADDEADFQRSRIAALALSDAELATWRLSRLDRADLHRATPYRMAALFDARRDLFAAAMALHKSFVVAAWKYLRPTLQAFVNLLIGNIPPGQIKQGPACLWDAFFLVVPVVSTAFASFPRLFAGIGREQLGWLLIDEAGQAAPQQAVGAIWRARRSIVVGDPLQLEPVVSVPPEIVAALLPRCGAERQWAPPLASAQVLADRANRYGTYLGEADAGDDRDRIWLGSPLVVHRRCLDPMFGISNSIAYGNMMVYGTAGGGEAGAIGPSCWYHVPASQSEGHWIEAQGRKALQLVRQIVGPRLPAGGQHKVYVITPFKQVARRIGELLEQEYSYASRGMSGTVHTFQGKEAEHVIFLLGGDPRAPGVISSFAGARPNLVNVAVTRAKRRLYVVGDQDYWTGPADVHGIYRTMAEHLSLQAAEE